MRLGDILLFNDRAGRGQHVAIFAGYDTKGHIRFIGSQVSTGPAEAGAAPGSYWNGDRFEVVGALRAKAEFQVRAPLHEAAHASARRTPQPEHPASAAAAERRDATHVASKPALQRGDHGPVVATLQHRLFELGYRTHDGRPLGVDGIFGTDTLHALKQFQREHGLEGKGVAGPRTEVALRRAETALISDPSHPQHRLFAQAYGKVREAEHAKGIPMGPHSARVAGAVAVEAIREGLNRIDRVVISDSGKLAWAVEDRPGGRESGLGRTDGINLRQASQQPLIESSQQASQVALNVRTQREELQRPVLQAQPALAR